MEKCKLFNGTMPRYFELEQYIEEWLAENPNRQITCRLFSTCIEHNAFDPNLIQGQEVVVCTLMIFYKE